MLSIKNGAAVDGGSVDLDETSFLYTDAPGILSLTRTDIHDESELDHKAHIGGTIQLSTLSQLACQRYNDSGPSSVNAGESNDLSEAGGSYTGARDDRESPWSAANAPSSNDDLSATLTSHTYASQALSWKEAAQIQGQRHPMAISDAGQEKLQVEPPEKPLEDGKSLLAGSPFHTGRSSSVSSNVVKERSYKPKSSIPSHLPWPEFARQSILAACFSRLNPYVLHPGEYRLLRRHITPSQVTTYLNIRNAILRLWIRSPLVSVTREEAAGCARDSRSVNLALVSYEWLLRNGYINFGCVEVPNTAIPESCTVTRKRPRTIVVIGAGMSGLGCARQLENIFAQLGDRWSSQGESPPKVVILEGRARVGGRVYSHPTQVQVPGSLPSNLRNTAEMGAQIVTGFEHGNPLNVLIRGQLALRYHGLRDNTILYDHDGKIVPLEQDMRVEKLYNDILERASVYRHRSPPIRTIEGARKLIAAGREPGVDNGLTIAELEDSGVNIDEAKASILKPGKSTSGIEKLAGRAYTLTSGFNPNASAAEAVESMGWKPKPGVPHQHTLNLDSVAKKSDHPTLGETMDDAIKQYQNILDLNAQDLRLLNWHHANLEYANAANVNQLSLSGWDQDIGNEFEGEHTEIIGGYQQVPRGLWQCPTKLDVRFSTPVESICYNADTNSKGISEKQAVTIKCGGGRTFDADKVVITAPLGVLKEGSIQFDPPLPRWKQDAIDKLGFGLLNKVVLVYEKPFWEEHRDMFGLLNEAEPPDSLNQSDYTSRRGRFYLFWNCIKTSGRPMLVALMAGDAAHSVETSDDHDLVWEVTDKLSKMFAPRVVPQPLESIVTRWKRDPFARGSYSYVGAQTRAGEYDTMARPIGPLHFAGEATCGTHPATVHGAYISGLRAAAEIADTFLGEIPIPSSPLIPRKLKTEAVVSPAFNGKRKLEDSAGGPGAKNARQSRNEDYEASIIGAISKELGERPVKPSKAGVNPFLLYTNDHWYHCKAECDNARRKATGNPEAKASRTEVRTALGAMWRNASEEVKRPYLVAAQDAKNATAAGLAAFKEKVAIWDKEATRIRQEFIKENPPPDGRPDLYGGYMIGEGSGRPRRAVS